jgi:hypothetical protein
MGPTGSQTSTNETSVGFPPASLFEQEVVYVRPQNGLDRPQHSSRKVRCKAPHLFGRALVPTYTILNHNQRFLARTGFAAHRNNQ